MSLKIENQNDIKAIVKYMTKAVKQDNKPPCFYDLKDLICDFENDNGFDYKFRVKIWNDFGGYEMKKSYENIHALLTKIVEVNKN